MQSIGTALFDHWQGYGTNGVQDIQTIEHDAHTNMSKAFISTPNVKREARAQFDCNSLPGGETEDKGGAGSGGGGIELSAHWDDRIYSVCSDICLLYTSPSPRD